jgi:8-amino-7-oxononanoate synthase
VRDPLSPESGDASVRGAGGAGSGGSDPRADWSARLAELEARDRRRRLREQPQGDDFLSSDYLGLTRHPELRAAINRALREEGAGGRASRLLAGGGEAHRHAERAAAEWLGEPAALLFPSGYQANLGLLQAVAEPGDLLLSDELCHASLIDGARLSRAQVQVYRHVDLDELDWWLGRSRAARRRWVLTEGVFSMDGDVAPIAELLELCARRDAHLLVDEAHAAGLLGPRGAGATAAAIEAGADCSHLAARVLTGGKALGVGGACLVGSLELRDWLVNRSRAFIYSTAPPTALAAGFARACELAAEADEARTRCLSNATVIARAVDAPAPGAAIVPWVLGSDARALAAAEHLEAAGIATLAVRPPTVPEGTARIRLVAQASQERAAFARLARAVGATREALGAVPGAARGECSGRADLADLTEVAELAERTPGAQAPLSPRQSSPRSEAAQADPTPHAARPTEAPSPAKTDALASTLAVVGTDTGVGKTVTSAALLRAALDRGPARYWKPVQTGDDDDTAEVGRLSGAPPGALNGPLRHFPLPASPHEAAAAAGEEITVGRLDERLLELRAASAAPLLVELAGGLLVPYRMDATQADWLQHHRLSVVLVARSGLGTLNHTALTLEALARRDLHVRGLILVGEPHPSNRRTLERLHPDLPVFELPLLAGEGSAPEADAVAAWVRSQDLSVVLP